jgi:hypothetical protein
MQLPAARILVDRLIETGERHQDYARVTELADTYNIYITGLGMEKKLIQYVPREDATMFAQRVRLTKAITPAVASSIRTPFNKVIRNDRIRKDIKIENEGRKQAVETMMKSYYGSKRKKNRGLEHWLKTRFVELQFTDPNAWVVVEWTAASNTGEVVQPRPFEVCSEWAINFLVINDETKWLFTKQPITFVSKTPQGSASTGVNAAPVPGVVQPAQDMEKNKGFRFTLYDEDVTVVYEQADPEMVKGMQLAENESTVEIKNITYIVRVYTPNVGYPPVMRIGYKRDDATKGRTFVNPWHDSLCFFDKSVKTVSELDISMTQHAFPQKIQYVHKCQGVSKEKRCNGGRTPAGEQCTACGGSGFKVHTTGMDTLLLPMPDSKDDVLDLEKLIAYKSPPIELIKFQNEYTQQLERQAHTAVFNSQALIKKTFQTATENENNFQSIYDALEPFTEKLSEIWREHVILFGMIAGETNADNIDATHEFPADYKLKTLDVLLNERKTANESGAPPFLVEAIDDDMAGITFAGDDLNLQKYRVKRRFYPFMGKSSDQVAEAVSSEFVPKAPKVLYFNFDVIFKEIERENPEFWLMTDFNKQKGIVDKKVQQYISILEAEKPVMTLNPLGDTNPLGNGEGDNTGTEDAGNNENNGNNNEGQ